MVLGGFGGSKVVSLTPTRALFAPLEVFFGTRFGSKHHIMVQVAHVNRVGTTESPYRGSQRAIIFANKARFEPWTVPKCHICGPNYIVLVVTTHMGHFGPKLVTLGLLMTFLGAKRLFGASKGLYLCI